MSAGPAAALLGAFAAAALLADRLESIATLAIVLLAVCLRARAPARRTYLFGAILPGVSVFLLWPLLSVEGHQLLLSGPAVPYLGALDVTVEELHGAATSALRLTAVALAFTAYALLLDHDRLLAPAGIARRSALAAALATRLIPTLERDARGLTEAIRGRGVVVEGLRGNARLLSPLVAGSLERAVNLAEAMEARGFGSRRPTRAPRPAWRRRDRVALVAAPIVVLMGVWWL